jgi:hypothetical protein
MVPIKQWASIFIVGLSLLFTNHAFADGIMFTCTGAEGYAVGVEGKSYAKQQSTASVKGWKLINDHDDTTRLLIRDQGWDISHYSKSGNKFVSYGDMGCTVTMPNQPVTTLNMLFTVTCDYTSSTFLFLDQDKGAKLIVTDLSAPIPTVDGSANYAIVRTYTSDCRKGE